MLAAEWQSIAACPMRVAQACEHALRCFGLGHSTACHITSQHEHGTAQHASLTKDDHHAGGKQAKPGQHCSHHKVVAGIHCDDGTQVGTEVEQGARQRLNNTQACAHTATGTGTQAHKVGGQGTDNVCLIPWDGGFCCAPLQLPQQLTLKGHYPSPAAARVRTIETPQRCSPCSSYHPWAQAHPAAPILHLHLHTNHPTTLKPHPPA